MLPLYTEHCGAFSKKLKKSRRFGKCSRAKAIFLVYVNHLVLNRKKKFNEISMFSHHKTFFLVRVFLPRAFRWLAGGAWRQSQQESRPNPNAWCLQVIFSGAEYGEAIRWLGVRDWLNSGPCTCKVCTPVSWMISPIPAKHSSFAWSLFKFLYQKCGSCLPFKIFFLFQNF